MNKANALLDERPELFIPSALIIGEAEETMKVTLPHFWFMWREKKKELKSWPETAKTAKTRGLKEYNSHCLALSTYYK